MNERSRGPAATAYRFQMNVMPFCPSCPLRGGATRSKLLPSLPSRCRNRPLPAIPEKAILGRKMTRNDERTRPNVPERVRTRKKKSGATKRDQTRRNATKRDLARSNTLANARNCRQTLVNARNCLHGTPDLRAPHVACKRPISPGAAEIPPPFLDSPAIGADTGTSTVSQRTPLCAFCAFSVLRVIAML